MAKEQAQQDELPETTTAVAANGHLMVYRVVGRWPDGAFRTSQWDAYCAPNCGACAEGYSRPNW
ncbi:hypothetical protein [Micromonospora maritima]|uniref:hypothetical protein n=1 Tax=Micromonospora maritima TaxID=986711 RepID=UPI00157BDA42|nr:hypothetical protein [Micromonospora maritima]